MDIWYICVCRILNKCIFLVLVNRKKVFYDVYIYSFLLEIYIMFNEMF